MANPRVERVLRIAGRRMFGQAVLNRLTNCLCIGLIAGLAWLFARPFVPHAVSSSWIFPTFCVGLGGIIPIVLAYRSRPSRELVALEVDHRFGLRERVITTVGLDAESAQTPAGQALVRDAEVHVGALPVAEKFPVRPHRSILAVPLLTIALALVAWLYNPTVFATDTHGGDANAEGSANPLAQANNRKVNPFTKPAALNQPERITKSEKLKEIEDELTRLGDKYTKDPFADTPEKAREKMTDLKPVEQKLKKFAEEERQKLEQLEQKLQKLEGLNKDKDFENGGGPAGEFTDALARGDLKKAEEEVDELRKKAKDKKLDRKEKEQLDRQLKKLKDELERLSREKEEELKQKIEEAKKKGQDAESLERELEKTKEENTSAQGLKDLAEKLGKAQEALKNNDLEKLEAELAGVKEELKGLEGEAEDLKDAEVALQRVKEERKAACKACQGEGEGGEKGEDGKLVARPSGPNNGGIGAGKREINDKAETAAGSEERIRGPFDIQGKKYNGGLVRGGSSFTKKSDAELGNAIKLAAQEAPTAPDAQRLPRDARESVKEYFERLGGTGNNK